MQALVTFLDGWRALGPFSLPGDVVSLARRKTAGPDPLHQGSMLKGAGLGPPSRPSPQCPIRSTRRQPRRPAWRAAAVAYRQARRDGASHGAAMDAAERSLQEQWPELSAKEASAELVAAWFWDGVGG